MENLIIAAITSGVVTALITFFGRMADNNRVDKNDRIKEYRTDLDTLKTEIRDLQDRLDKVEEEKLVIKDENIILKGRVRDLEEDNKDLRDQLEALQKKV